MSLINKPILIVAYSDDVRELLGKNLAAQDVAVTPCATFCEAENLAQENSYNGILIDLPSIIKAKGEEKVVAYTLASIYPTLRVRSMGSMLVPMAMPGDAKQDSSLGDFIKKTCFSFTPRGLRRHRRRDICISTVRMESGVEVRGFTHNISWGGAFIVDTHPEQFIVGQEMVISLQEPGLEVLVKICWIQNWGERRFPGIGVKFLNIDETLETALFQLLKHDKEHDRDRITA